MQGFMCLLPRGPVDSHIYCFCNSGRYICQSYNEALRTKFK